MYNIGIFMLKERETRSFRRLLIPEEGIVLSCRNAQSDLNNHFVETSCVGLMFESIKQCISQTS